LIRKNGQTSTKVDQRYGAVTPNYYAELADEEDNEYGRLGLDWAADLI
jgi:hypothetical protein